MSLAGIRKADKDRIMTIMTEFIEKGSAFTGEDVAELFWDRHYPDTAASPRPLHGPYLTKLKISQAVRKYYSLGNECFVGWAMMLHPSLDLKFDRPIIFFKPTRYIPSGGFHGYSNRGLIKTIVRIRVSSKYITDLKL